MSRTVEVTITRKLTVWEAAEYTLEIPDDCDDDFEYAEEDYEALKGTKESEDLVWNEYESDIESEEVYSVDVIEAYEKESEE